MSDSNKFPFEKQPPTSQLASPFFEYTYPLWATKLIIIIEKPIPMPVTSADKHFRMKTSCKEMTALKTPPDQAALGGNVSFDVTLLHYFNCTLSESFIVGPLRKRCCCKAILRERMKYQIYNCQLLPLRGRKGGGGHSFKSLPIFLDTVRPNI